MINYFLERHVSWIDWTATPILAAVLLVLSAIDLREMRLPNYATLPLLAAGLALAYWRHSGALPWMELAGAAAGYGVFWIIGQVFWRLKKREGLGLGDAKFVAAGGAWVGLGLLPMVVLIAASSALIFIYFSGRDTRAPLPFGPWLSLGIWISWLVHLHTA